jgi:RHS repeat-associated protein
LATADGTLVAEYDYDPYGRLIRETGPQAATCPFRYSTKYRDPDLELYYYGYRWYDAASLKWLTPDPIGERGGANLLRGATELGILRTVGVAERSSVAIRFGSIVGMTR